MSPILDHEEFEFDPDLFEGGGQCRRLLVGNKLVLGAVDCQDRSVGRADMMEWAGLFVRFGSLLATLPHQARDHPLGSVGKARGQIGRASQGDDGLHGTGDTGIIADRGNVSPSVVPSKRASVSSRRAADHADSVGVDIEFLGPTSQIPDGGFDILDLGREMVARGASRYLTVAATYPCCASENTAP